MVFGTASTTAWLCFSLSPGGGIHIEHARALPPNNDAASARSGGTSTRAPGARVGRLPWAGSAHVRDSHGDEALFTHDALLPAGWARNVRIELDGHGSIGKRTNFCRLTCNEIIVACCPTDDGYPNKQ